MVVAAIPDPAATPGRQNKAYIRKCGPGACSGAQSVKSVTSGNTESPLD